VYLRGIKSETIIMRKTTLILTFLAVVACGRAQEFLTPASIRSTDVFDDIFETLLTNGERITNRYVDSPEFLLNMGTYYVSTPSFSPEYALIIRENELVLKKATTVLQYSIYSKRRMKDPDFRKLDKDIQKQMRELAKKLENNPVNRYSLPISKETSDQLTTLFEYATKTATYLENHTIGTDGIRYYFNHSRKLGSVWLPFSGRTLLLVEMADSICYAVEHQNIDVFERQMKVCKDLTQSFKKEFPLYHFRCTRFTHYTNQEKGTGHLQIGGGYGEECMQLEIFTDSAVNAETGSKVLHQYTDSLSSWSREIFLTSDNPTYPSIVIDNHADTAICLSKQYERGISREITIPDTYWRREVILTAAQLPPGQYYYSEGEWRKQ
jgi:hypothetical protein